MNPSRVQSKLQMAQLSQATQLKGYAQCADRNVALLETVDRDGIPYLMLFTTSRISIGTELLLDYGDPFWHYFTAELNRLKAVAVRAACLQLGQADGQGTSSGIAASASHYCLSWACLLSNDDYGLHCLHMQCF